ncbi:hypothetical protein GCM10009678_78930 [Actinomadura kijaniata]
MSDQWPERDDRTDTSPGAQSGSEDLPHDRTVPGTESATEGYETEGGTRHGDPLAGVEADEGAEGDTTSR